MKLQFQYHLEENFNTVDQRGRNPCSPGTLKQSEGCNPSMLKKKNKRRGLGREEVAVQVAKNKQRKKRDLSTAALIDV